MFDYAFVERSANVVLFVPLGLFVALLLPRRRWWIAALTGLAVSGAIETAQLLLLPARFATLDDVAMNTTGALLGAAASLLLLRRR
jgi:glycopeptide antibiotics resistance protein